MENFGQLLDVDRRDRDATLKDAQFRAYSRHLSATTCRDVMSRDVIAIAPHSLLSEALDLLRRHHIKALPVTDDRRKVLGIVTQTDLLDKSVWGAKGPRLTFRSRLKLTLSRGRAPHGAVEDVMTTPVRTVRPDAPIAEVAIGMSGSGLHHLPVVDDGGRLVGI